MLKWILVFVGFAYLALAIGIVHENVESIYRMVKEIEERLDRLP